MGLPTWGEHSSATYLLSQWAPRSSLHSAESQCKKTTCSAFKSPSFDEMLAASSSTCSIQHLRSAPKGRQQMGETGFCKNLRFSAVSCENLRFPAVFCANLRLPNLLIYRASRKSAKICKNLRKCAFRVRFLPFAVSLLARPETMSRI